MKTANSARGEVALLLGEEDYILRPSFDALVAAESEIGSLFDFVDRAAMGQAKIVEVVALFWHCFVNIKDMERDQFSEYLVGILSLIHI